MENKIAEVHFLDIPEDKENESLINTVLEKAFQEETLDKLNLYINVILTNPSMIRRTNKTYRNIDKETDVLSFPMFEKEELQEKIKNGQPFPVKEALGDVMISIERVKEQAQEYGHSFQRELAYMLVHGFYHLMGYDHIEEEDKKQMRNKEEVILNILHITRSE